MKLRYLVIDVRQFKEAVLKPKIKKTSLDNEQLPSFRPISNIRFIAKATEKVVSSRLNCHLNDSGLHELSQSAYKQGHSTETAMVRVYNDILYGIDNGGNVILLLLDLSAAFDTVDYAILLSRLSNKPMKYETYEIQTYEKQRKPTQIFTNTGYKPPNLKLRLHTVNQSGRFRILVNVI